MDRTKEDERGGDKIPDMIEKIKDVIKIMKEEKDIRIKEIDYDNKIDQTHIKVVRSEKH